MDSFTASIKVQILCKDAIFHIMITLRVNKMYNNVIANSICRLWS